MSLLVAAVRSPADRATAALTAYGALGPAKTGLAVFHTRLGITLVDALNEDHPAVEQIAGGLIGNAVHDGYAAREILSHPRCPSTASSQQIRQLTTLVSECGLSIGAIPSTHLAALTRALDTAESVIARPSPLPTSQPA
jgi:hypothetical protein